MFPSVAQLNKYSKFNQLDLPPRNEFLSSKGAHPPLLEPLHLIIKLKPVQLVSQTYFSCVSFYPPGCIPHCRPVWRWPRTRLLCCEQRGSTHWLVREWNKHTQLLVLDLNVLDFLFFSNMKKTEWKISPNLWEHSLDFFFGFCHIVPVAAEKYNNISGI